jgi:hypothetical protein
LEGFLEALANCACQIQLASLRLVEMNPDRCQTLKTCVLQMPGLRHLCLAHITDPSRSSRILLEMLRQNASVRTFLVEDQKYDMFTGLLFDTVGWRLAGAYCQRNRHLAALLEHQEAESDPPMDRAGQALYPSLLQVAKQIPSSRLWSLASSLEKLGDCIGPVATA